MLESSASKKRLSPLDFRDYRQFLSAHVELKKSQNSQWSYNVWARALGLKSSSTLIMIMKGQRNPGHGLIQDFTKYFAFKPAEEKYFSDLVRLAKNRHDIQLSLSLMKELEEKNKGRGFKLLDHDSFQMIANWYYYAIREMVHLEDFREDPIWIAGRLRFAVDELQIREAIETLLRLQLLKRDEHGQLQYADAHVNTPKDIANEALKKHHEQQLENAKKSVRELTPQERSITGGSFAIRSTDLDKAKKMIRDFQMQLCQELESKTADSVFQIEIAFFPMTQMIKDNTHEK